MQKLRYIVVAPTGPVPIHFSSIAQAIRVAERINGSGWVIRVAKACSPSVCGNGTDACAVDQQEMLESRSRKQIGLA